MTPRAIFTAAAALALVQVATAQAADSLASRRHAYFEEQGRVFKAIGEGLRADGAPSPAVIAGAGKLKALAAQLPGWFPKGSGPESGAKTGAKAEIWSDPSGFAAASDLLTAETAKLEQLSRTGDVAQLRVQARAVGGACRNCHEKYRANSFSLLAR